MGQNIENEGQYSGKWGQKKQNGGQYIGKWGQNTENEGQYSGKWGQNTENEGQYIGKSRLEYRKWGPVYTEIGPKYRKIRASKLKNKTSMQNSYVVLDNRKLW